MKRVPVFPFRRLAVFFGLLLSSAGMAFAQTFTVSANPQSLTVYPGQTNVPVSISVASTNSVSPVNVTLTGLPTGVTLSPAVISVTPGSSGTIMLNVATNADQEQFPTNGLGLSAGTTQVSVVGAIGSTTATSGLSLTVSISNPNFIPSQVNMPIIRLTTSAPLPVNEDSVSGTVLLTSANGQTTYIPGTASSDNTMSMHIHGNSTSHFPKQAYTLKLGSSVDLLTSLGLTCPYTTGKKGICDKSKSYILLANYADKTMLRDWAASALANAIPYGNGYLATAAGSPTPSGDSRLMPWAPHSLFVELYLNGTYEGVYQLIEKPNVDSHRVNITELGETDSSPSLVTGGYLLELNQAQGEDVTFKTNRGLRLALQDPDFTPDPPNQAQLDYISGYMNSFEDALYGPNFTSPTLGWRAYFDEAAAINFYLVNEIFMNEDGSSFYASDYLYKERGNPLLYMGPVWDFDLSSGNSSTGIANQPIGLYMATHATWYKQLYLDPGFVADLKTQFNALKNNGVFTNWINSIMTQANTMQQGAANNFNRWPMLNMQVWGNAQVAGSYQNEVKYLTDFLNLRIAYLDSYFNQKATSSIMVNSSATTLSLGSPVTLTAKVTAAHATTGVVTFFSTKVNIGTATLDANGIATLVTTRLQLGTGYVQAYYSGDSVNALAASPKLYFTVTPKPTTTVTNLAVSNTALQPGMAASFTVSVLPNGTVAPTGSVTFSSNGVTLATVTLNPAGTASLSTTDLPVGTNSIVAVYSGDASNLASSSSAVSVSVDPNTEAITIGTNPVGAAYIVDGASYSSAQTFYYEAGSMHTLSVIANQMSADTISTFSGWSDSGAQTHTITTPATATTYTANFTNAYLLTTAASPSAFGTISATAGASGFYPQGTVVNLAANPQTGYIFNGWTGAVANTASQSTTVTMNAPQTVTASFLPNGAGISYPNGFQAGNLTLNGSTAFSGSTLKMTYRNYQAGSVYYNYAMNTKSFTTDFTFQLSTPVAGGLTFVLQNQGLSAVGTYGGSLGYAAAVTPSVAVKFDVTSDASGATNSTGIYVNGAIPSSPATDLTSTGVNLASGDPFQAHLAYDGTTLIVTLTDTVTNATATQQYAIDIPGTIGAPYAYAGFTAGTGAGGGTENVLNWTYSPGATVGQVAAPTFTLPPGTYTGAQQVGILETTPGATIYYTTDGSPATPESTPYSGTITLSSITTLNAVAYVGSTASAQSTAVYMVHIDPALSLVAIPSMQYTASPLTLNATTLSPAPIAYTVVSGRATVSGNQLTLTGTGPVSLKATQAASGSYLAGTATTSFTVALATPTLAFNTVADTNYGAGPFIVSATSNSPGRETFSVVSGPATISGNTVSITGTGTVQLQVTQAPSGYYDTATATTTFQVGPALAVPTLQVTIPTLSLGDGPYAVSAVSNSPGAITYAVTGGPATMSGNLISLTGTVGTLTLKVSQAASGGYAATSMTTYPKVVARADDLAFAPVNSVTYGAGPFAVSASSSSAGAITYSVTSGPATIAGNVVTVTGVGTVKLTASQAAAGDYAAGTAQASFTVSAQSNTLALDPIPSKTYGDPAFTVNATSNSPAAITYTISGPATISGNTVTLSGWGTVTVTAKQAATGTFNAATVTQTFTVAALNPGLAFVPIGSKTYPGSTFTVGATSASTGSKTYSVVSGPATISGTTVTLTGTGTVMMQVSQVASGNYAAATATTSFNVTAPLTTPTLTVSVPALTLGGGPFAVSASSNSPGEITYAITGGPATMNGNVIVLTGTTGTLTLKVSQAASGGYAATSVLQYPRIVAQTDNLAFTPAGPVVWGVAPFAVNATSSSTGAITYSVTSGPGTISGNVVTVTGIGTIKLAASQAAAGNYAAGTASMNIVVSAQTPTLAFDPIPSKTFGDSPVTVNATSSSPAAIVYSVSGPATISGNVVTISGYGTVKLTAKQAATGNYSSASATTSFTVAQADPGLAFDAIANMSYTAAPFTVNASSSSPATKKYTVVSGPAKIYGSTVTLTGTGTVVLQVTQAASGSYAADTATVSFNVTPAS